MKCPACGYDNTEGSSFCVQCGSPMARRTKAKTEKISRSLFNGSDFSLSPGNSFGNRYQIIKEIDRGGMGQVYQAEDKELNITVALKIIHPHYLTDGQAVERFKKEILLAREISHENVIRIHDFGEEQGIKFISMQFVEGENLKDIIKKKRSLGLKRTLDISHQICSGLGAAHRKGIVHRDLKPHNIMIDRRGQVVVMDFGLAKSIEGEGISLPDIVVGTPEYISPEQARGEKVDGRSDVYSLGVMMYELATGKLPFRSETVLGYITKHLNEKPVSPSISNPLIPDFFSRIIMKCLEKNPGRRYQNTGELIKDFSDEEAARGPFLKRPLVRKMLSVSSVVLLMAMVAAGVFFIRENKREADYLSSTVEKRSVAVMYFENHTGDRELDRWSIALADLIITDLTQSRYFRVLPENRLFEILRELGQDKARRILPETMKEVASRGGVDHIITGGFVRAGDVFRVSIKILDPVKGEYVDSGYADGRGVESFFSIVDRLTTKVKTLFNIPQPKIMADIDREVTQITTSSAQAFQYYISGKHYANLTKYQKSIESFKKAIELDPEFAMAYWAMGFSYAFVGDWENRGKSFSRTMELLDHVSERERYLTEGTFYGESEITFQQSIDAYEKLLKLYPDDCAGNEQLGVNYQFIEKWDRSVTCLEKNRKNKCLSLHGTIYLSYSYMAKGEYGKALEVLDEATKTFSDNGLIRQFKSKIYLVQNMFDLALHEMEKAAEFDPEDYRFKLLIGDIYFLKNDFEKAENVYRENLNKKEVNRYSDSLSKIRSLYFLQGRYKECNAVYENNKEFELKNLKSPQMVMSLIRRSYYYLKKNKPIESLKLGEEAIEIHKTSGYRHHTHERLALYLKALAQLDLNQWENASATTKNLKKSIDSCCHQHQLNFYYHLMGVKALKKQQYKKSINYFKRALSFQSKQVSFHFGRDMHAILYNDLASAYIKNGEIDRAIDYYKKIITLTTGRFSFGDIYAQSFYHLAKIYQKKGWEGKALDYYEKFLFIWKQADPDFPELRDAKKRLAILKKNSS